MKNTSFSGLRKGYFRGSLIACLKGSIEFSRGAGKEWQPPLWVVKPQVGLLVNTFWPLPDHLEKCVPGKPLPLNPAVCPHTLNSRGQIGTFFISFPFSLFFLQTVSVLSMKLALGWSLEILCRFGEWFLTPQGDVISVQFSCWPGQECCAHETCSMPIFRFCLEYKCFPSLWNTCTPNSIA